MSTAVITTGTYPTMTKGSFTFTFLKNRNIHMILVTLKKT